MKVENISKSRVKVVFDVTADEFDKALDDAFTTVNKNVKMDGFRKGAAPKGIFIKKFGIESLYEEALNVIFNAKAREVYAEKDLANKMVGQFMPNVEMTGDEKLEQGKDFKVSLTFDVMPEFELPQYKGLEVAKPVYEATEVEVAAAIKEMAKAQGKTEVKKDQVINSGDIAKFDFVGSVDGVEFQGGSAKDYELQIGSGQFIPGFEDQMIGMKAGETKDLNVTFPEQYQAKELAGKAAVFKVTVNEVKEEVLPEINDEFVATLKIEGVNNVEELKAYEKKEIEAQKAISEKDKEVDTLINKILDSADIDLPEALVEDRYNAMRSQYENQAKQYGIPFETFLQFMGTTLAQFEDITKKQAANNVKFSLIMSKLIEVEKLEPSKEELQARAEKDVEASKLTVDQLLEKNVANYYNELVYNKAIDLIVKNAKEI